MNRIAALLLVLLLSASLAAAQKPPAVHFNHLYFVIDSADLAAIQNSSFIKNTLAAFQVRTTKADHDRSWTGTYFYGIDNYIELFDSSGVHEPTGISGIGFSTEQVGELDRLHMLLAAYYAMDTFETKKDIDGKKIPWFDGLAINDSVFENDSYFGFWMMEYKKEYFDYNKFDYKGNNLTGSNYLKHFDAERKEKVLKRFSGVTMRLTAYERKFLTDFFERIGYQKTGENQYTTPDHFQFDLKERAPGTFKTIESISFENSRNFPEQVVSVSPNIRVEIHGKTGRIVF